MAEPFKNLFNTKIIKGMATHFADQWPQFDKKGFIKAATHDLDALELKERSVQITDAMRQYLPEDYSHAADIMLNALAENEDCHITDSTVTKEGIAGWAVMPMAHYVGLYGLDHFDLSMTLFKEMTKRSSSEFGIRFFILADAERTLDYLHEWAGDPNHHVRRLVSEGSRPRLPWAMQFPEFIKDPTPILPLLEQLKDDESEYVRRSVANNLNDIAKDHPNTVAKIAKRWIKGASKERQKLVRHACRTLVKQGHTATLSALGYEPAKVVLENFKVLTPKVVLGNALQFELTVVSKGKKEQPLIVDYIVHHQKANGSTSPKVFKWKTLTLPAGKSKIMQRKHAIRPITTRVYYPGVHGLEVVINGQSLGRVEFSLALP
ncbi:DNA alkylation repair protein [Pseudomonadota bacterium]